jgi:hypothetical protein
MVAQGAFLRLVTLNVSKSLQSFHILFDTSKVISPCFLEMFRPALKIMLTLKLDFDIMMGQSLCRVGRTVTPLTPLMLAVARKLWYTSIGSLIDFWDPYQIWFDLQTLLPVE